MSNDSSPSSNTIDTSHLNQSYGLVDVTQLVIDYKQPALIQSLPLLTPSQHKEMAKAAGKHCRPDVATVLLRFSESPETVIQDVLDGAWIGDSPEMVYWIIEQKILGSGHVHGYIMARLQSEKRDRLGAAYGDILRKDWIK